MRRTLALWLLLFGAYAATLELGRRRGGERRYLEAAEALFERGDVGDAGVGFPLLIAPAHALAGSDGVELFLAALAALAGALAYRLALRVAPDPWALGAAAAVGLSAPLLAASTAVQPEATAAAALAGAALLALHLDTRPGWRPAFGCFALIGALPWLGVLFVPAGAVVGIFAARSLWRARRRTLAVGSVELALFSVAFWVGVNEALFGRPLSGPVASPARWELLPFAPVLVLAFAGLLWLWRSHRDRLARAVPQLREIELTAEVCAAAVAALLVAAAPAAALALAVPLVAWGLRRSPRLGLALTALTLAASVWLYLGDGSLVNL